MSVKAFVLIETAIARSGEVAAELRRMEGVKSVDVVTGPYDLIAVADQPDVKSVSTLVTERASHIPGVKRAITCIAVRPT